MLDHVLLPVATEADARVTSEALRPYLEDIERVTASHVIEKAGGAPDKAPLEKRQSDAAEFLAIVESELADEVAFDARIDYGTDVVDALFEAAEDAGATAIAFHPRDESWLVRLLSGSTATKIVTDPVVPVVSLPDPGLGEV